MAKKPVQIMETVLRDGHQSLCATRMRTSDMLPQLEALDAVGYKALEAWGGATFDTCLRFLDEDPWERLDTLKSKLKTPIQMLLRGQNLLGYNHYSNDVVEKFVQKASAHGVGVFRIFDALNDVRNLRVAIDAALKCPEKPEVQGCLVYTVSPVHTNEMFVDLAKQLQEMGCHSICIKDMSGLLKPYVAEDLVKKLKAALDIPVELHTHCTSGFGHATYLKAVEAGVDVIDCALAPFSSDTSQPCTETMIRMLEGTEHDTGIDVQQLTPISKYFLEVKKRLIKEFNLKGYFDINPNVLDFQIPGGMLSNLANQLKEAGYEIEAVPNKGYKLLSVPDTLSEEELKSIRKTAWVGQEIFYYPVIDSTNTRAKQLAEEDYPTGTLVVAGQQDAGRGRRGRSFESPQGAGIFMTLMLKPELSPVNAPMLTLVAALAVSAAIVKTTGRPAGIKWPNDIVMNGKKVCGILTEMSAQMDYVNHIVIGIGINVHNESFPEEIAPVATSLYMETGEHFNRAALIEEVWEQFEHYYAIFMETEDLSGLVKEYDTHLINRNQIVKVLDPKEPFEGKAMGITPRGELIVDTWESRRLVSAGEVSVRGVYGYV